MVAWHRLRILDTSRCIRIWGIPFHSSRSIRLRSRRVETCVICLRTARPSWSHTCSMGLRSGLHAGHSIRSTRWAWRWSVMMRARWGRALSSCMIAPAPRVRRYGKTTGVKISSLYLMAFMLPSTMMRGVFPVMEIPPKPSRLKHWTLSTFWAFIEFIYHIWALNEGTQTLLTCVDIVDHSSASIFGTFGIRPPPCLGAHN